MHGPLNFHTAADNATDRRLRWLLVGLAICCCGTLARLATLEVLHGDGLRAEASRPATRTVVAPAMRGRILARDGTVLAYDQPLAVLAVQYRMFEEPADPHWLRAKREQAFPPANAAGRNASLKKQGGYSPSERKCSTSWPAFAD